MWVTNIPSRTNTRTELALFAPAGPGILWSTWAQAAGIERRDPPAVDRDGATVGAPIPWCAHRSEPWLRGVPVSQLSSLEGVMDETIPSYVLVLDTTPKLATAGEVY
jgi:hypothetical protein